MSEFERLLRKQERKSHLAGWLWALRRWWTDALRSRTTSGDSRSARDLLERVRGLRATQAGWPRILSVVNPRNDKVAAELLTELRNPHLFATHVALNALEDACERVMASNGRASDIDALREATRQSGRVTQFGR